MNIIYTRHAREQREERKIIPLWIEETIKCPDVIEREGDKFQATKRLNGKTL